MTRWWMSVALAAVWFGHGAATQAQNPYSAPGGRNLPPEPAPISLTEQAMPGPSGPGFAPQGPGFAPQGPPDALSLPASVPGAFTDRVLATETGVYVHIGMTALHRQRPGSLPLAVLDPNTGLVDTGNQPFPLNLAVIQQTSSVSPEFELGARATIGYLCDNHAIEATGFYLPKHTSNATAIVPGRIDALFVNPPIGFEGDNGLWQQADVMQTSLNTALGSGEINYRYWNKAVVEAELILGVRYIDFDERLRILTDDDAETVRDVLGRIDLTREATYNVRAHSRIVGPQIGFDWNHSCCSWLSTNLTAKGACGINFYDVHLNLQRADGLVGSAGTRNQDIVSGVQELSAAVDIHWLERFRLRGGYTALWLLNVPEATSQVDYNLANPLGKKNDHGSVFFHGPTLELQFLF